MRAEPYFLLFGILERQIDENRAAILAADDDQRQHLREELDAMIRVQLDLIEKRNLALSSLSALD